MPCQNCGDIKRDGDACCERREMAQTLRNVVVRMKIAQTYGDAFVFAREKLEPADRFMWEQWAYLRLYEQGMEWAA